LYLVKGALKNPLQGHDLPQMPHPAWLVLLCLVVWLATCAAR